MATTTNDNDLNLNNLKGYYDFSFDTDGDFDKTDTLDTALFTSLLSDSRASSAEVKSSYNRGGWWGNVFLDTRQGSKLWLLYQQPANNNTLSQAISYAKDALQWLLDDEFADKVNVSGSQIAVGKIQLIVSIIKNGSKITEKVYDLWQNTLKEAS